MFALRSPATARPLVPAPASLLSPLVADRRSLHHPDACEPHWLRRAGAGGCGLCDGLPLGRAAEAGHECLTGLSCCSKRAVRPKGPLQRVRRILLRFRRTRGAQHRRTKRCRSWGPGDRDEGSTGSHIGEEAAGGVALAPKAWGKVWPSLTELEAHEGVNTRERQHPCGVCGQRVS